MRCRHCNESLDLIFLDLGFSPLANAYLSGDDLNASEIYYPLRIAVCKNCWLVQTEDYAGAKDFFGPDYAYFSSVSSSWLEHSKIYSDKIIRDLSLNANSFVVEVACNDGYLLKNFVDQGIPCLGVEPTQGTAQAARKLGIQVIEDFFSDSVATEMKKSGVNADLVIGNNVFAHVPDINDFTAGLKTILKPEGVITLEFQHILSLVEKNQFDTFYHEHCSYLSLYTASKIFHEAGLRIWHVEKLTTHGGSLRIYGCHAESLRPTMNSVGEVLNSERSGGLQTELFYFSFQNRVNQIKNEFLEFLIAQHKLGKKIAAYGAAAKGNTLLNYSGVKCDIVSVIYDKAKSKQGKFMPGSHLPIVSPSEISKDKPDFLIILPWNISDEIMSDLPDINSWGGKALTAIPKLTFL